MSIRGGDEEEVMEQRELRRGLMLEPGNLDLLYRYVLAMVRNGETPPYIDHELMTLNIVPGPWQQQQIKVIVATLIKAGVVPGVYFDLSLTVRPSPPSIFRQEDLHPFSRGRDSLVQTGRPNLGAVVRSIYSSLMFGAEPRPTAIASRRAMLPQKVDERDVSGDFGYSSRVLDPDGTPSWHSMRRRVEEWQTSVDGPLLFSQIEQFSRFVKHTNKGRKQLYRIFVPVWILDRLFAILATTSRQGFSRRTNWTVSSSNINWTVPNQVRNLTRELKDEIEEFSMGGTRLGLSTDDPQMVALARDPERRLWDDELGQMEIESRAIRKFKINSPIELARMISDNSLVSQGIDWSQS